MEEETRRFKRKVGRPSKQDLEDEIALNYLSQILVGIYLDQCALRKDKSRVAKPHTKRKA